MQPGQKQVDIPFEYVNNFIILKVTFNGSFPLKFIFDTGAENTVLTKREISDLMLVQYDRQFKVKGSDMKTDLIAYLARNIRLELPGRVVAPKEDIFVLEEDYFRFEEYAGVNVHGILSANAFAKYLIRINYDRNQLTLYERNAFRMKDPAFQAIPVEVFRNKMYLRSGAHLMRDSVAQVKLLLDTGAGLPLLLFSNTHPLVELPENTVPSNIGMGLGGYLEGFTGRVGQLDLGTFRQTGVLAYFQTLDTAGINLGYLNKRDGLVGNGLLHKFHVILDYYGFKIWLKPAKAYEDAYVYDRSGMGIVATGVSLNYFTVQFVLPNSPAAEAGIQQGDQIMRIGLTPTNFLSLGDVQRVFQKKAGKKIRLVMRREGKRFKTQLVLRDLI
jgi:hypothetical protein